MTALVGRGRDERLQLGLWRYGPNSPKTASRIVVGRVVPFGPRFAVRQRLYPVLALKLFPKVFNGLGWALAQDDSHLSHTKSAPHNRLVVTLTLPR
jgi:hypothetical protein